MVLGCCLKAIYLHETVESSLDDWIGGIEELKSIFRRDKNTELDVLRIYQMKKEGERFIS